MTPLQEARIKYYRENREKIKARAKERYAAKRDEILESVKARYWADPAKHSAYHAARRKKDAEKLRIQNAEYYMANRARLAIQHLEWARSNRDTLRANRQRRRAMKMSVGGAFTKADIAEIKRAQKNKCAYCKQKLTQKYHCDHIMPLALSGSNDRTNIQILCETCNCKKNAMHPNDFARRIGLLL